MTRLIPVFVNGTRVEIRDDATALDAVRAWNADAGAALAAGARALTDSRGLPVDAGAPLAAGSIFRLTAGRDREAAPEAE